MRSVGTVETESGALRLLKEEFSEELLAVMLTGSHGTADHASSSDIDFLVVIASPRRPRKNFVFQGKEIELFINPAPQIEQYLEEDRASGRGAMQRMLVTGAPLYDPQGVLAKLREIAMAQWKQGPLKSRRKKLGALCATQILGPTRLPS
jgi:predicted nucleotidyltransferase